MFTDKVIIVTGGTKGIGKSIVLEFLKQNANVITIYSKEDDALQKMKEGLSVEAVDKFFAYKGSISDIIFLSSFFQKVKTKFGKIDVLVNNAGINRDSLFLDMSEDDWNIVININVKGTLNMSLLASEIMKESTERGFIINISSISGVFGRVGQANYACSKGAIIGITKLLAKKLAKYNINVNAVIPGLIRTVMTDVTSEEKNNEIIEATILKRIGEPEEVAKAVLCLAGEVSSYISGTCIKIDGGFLK